MPDTDTATRTNICPTCPSGRLEDGYTILTLEGEPIIVVTDVPAEVCDVCGEAVVDGDTTRRIEEFVGTIRLHWVSQDAREMGPTTIVDHADTVVGGTPGEEGGIVRAKFPDVHAALSQM